MSAPCDESDDSDLIEEIQRRIAENGRLVSRREIWVSGVRFGPALYALSNLGLPPDREPHDWIDVRNSSIESGEMCRKCGKLIAGNEHTSNK